MDRWPITPLTTDNLAGNANLARRFNVVTMSARTVAFNTETNEVKEASNRCHALCLSNQLSESTLNKLLKNRKWELFRNLYPALACAEFITNAHACRLLHPQVWLRDREDLPSVLRIHSALLAGSSKKEFESL